MGIFLMFIMFLILLYAGVNFLGLRDREAMDMAQLGRNIARGRGYATQFIRPFELWYLQQVHREPLLGDAQATQPELYTPPVYPFVLSAAFRIGKPTFEFTGKQTLGADRIVMYTALFFYVVGLVLTFLIALELFDRRVAWLAAFLYAFCDPLLDFAIAGLPMGFLSVLFLIVCYGLLKVEKWSLISKPVWQIYAALIVSTLAIGIGTLTNYAFAALLVPLFFQIAVSFRLQSPVKIFVCGVLFGMMMIPWMARNYRVSHTLFGLTHFELLEGTAIGQPEEVRPGQLQRNYLNEELPPFKFRTLISKAMLNMRRMYESGAKEIGANYLFVFFVVGLIHRFRLEEAHRLRRFVFWSVLAIIVWLGFAGPPKRNFLTMFAPMIIVYGAAYFYVVFERLQFRTRLLRWSVIGLFVGFNALPMAFALMPPKTTQPYPPYDAGICTSLAKFFHEDEIFLTDIPWAVAWYTDRTSIWVPNEEEDFTKIHLDIHWIAAIYMTQVTLNDLKVDDMLAGKRLFWIRLFQPPPKEFPLQYYAPVNNERSQVITSHRRL